METQVTLDEWIDIAIEDVFCVVHFQLQAMVVHHLVGMKDVAAELAAEIDIALGVFFFRGRFLTCLQRHFV